MKKYQKGNIGHGLEKAMTAFIIMVIVVSAILGWVSIEGIIWLFKHISIGVV